ncbi:MAG TPA: tetratricopeptide repeat protein [Ktedonobacterales bacterium]|jgi:serine/threonine protein kinase
MIGQHLTDYATVDVMVEREAHGGFGRVYMGADHRFYDGRWLALKTLHPRYLATERGRRLFLNECMTWVGLWPHANLLTAKAVIPINGQPFLILDYAELGNLRDYLYRAAANLHGQPLPIGVALLLAQQIAASLVALHTPDPAFLRPQPIVHRDLKPENILLSHSYAMITDFGLAKVISELVASEDRGGEADADDHTSDIHSMHADDNHGTHAASAALSTQSRRYHTQRGVAMGTFPYIPPEQWVDAASAGPPADLYAFGIILGELFTGDHPLLTWRRGRFADEEQWRRTHFQATPPTLATARAQARHAAGATEDEPPLPGELETLFVRLLAKQAVERPATDEMLASLRQAASALGQEPYTSPEVTPHTSEQECIKWHNLAISHMQFGLHQKALEHNDRALALAPTAIAGNVLLIRGTILADLRRLEEALDCYDRALASFPATDSFRCGVVWNHRANQLKGAGRYREAEEAYAQAVQLTPENPGYWYNRAKNEWEWGQTLAAVGEQAAAVEHWSHGLSYAEEALRRNPDDPTSTGQRADLLSALGSPAEAEAAYAQAVKLMPENPVYWHNRALNEQLWGVDLAANGQRAEAEQHWRRGLDYAEEAVRLNPDDPRYIQTRDVLRQLLSIRQ